MATSTISVDSKLFEAAQVEADRRHTTVNVIVEEYLKALVTAPYNHPEASVGAAWIPGVTRAMTYWERGIGEPNEQVNALEELVAFAEAHPCSVDLTSFSREDLHERG